MNSWKKRSVASALLLVLAAAPAWAAGPEGAAESPSPILISAPVEDPPLPKAPLHDVTAGRQKPEAIAVDGKVVAEGEAFTVLNGSLMVPLRAIVEGAGGRVDWDGATQTVTIRLSDRWATFVIDEGKAEMNQDGHRYLQRNFIQMAEAPTLINSRTLISADALSSILGFLERHPEDPTMDLLRAGQSTSPAPAEAEEPAALNILSGAITKVEEGASNRVLVEGEAMSNGEPNLTWVTISEETRILIKVDGVEKNGTLADLEAGQRVTIELAGPVLTSYPARASAASIVVE